jgi:hypothetical protein
MNPSYSEIFDRSKLQMASLSQRHHNLDQSIIMPLALHACNYDALKQVAHKIIMAGQAGSAVILMMGAHVIRAGVQRFIIDLMERGAISCIALNGAGVIHDYELSLIGATTESVAGYIKDGSFGMWHETGRINDIVADAAQQNMGLGQAIGKHIEDEKLIYREVSIFAAGYRLNIPVTVHVGIGYDIVFELPNCNGAAYGAASFTDFLRFARILQNLEGGVVMNFGSAVMAPEVYLKALAMARNAARQQKKEIRHFSTLVCDLVNLPADYTNEPSSDDPRYYFRPWKTMLVRTVKDGGQSYYVCGKHEKTIPQLWSAFATIDDNRKSERI